MVLFEALGSEFSYPTSLHDVTFGKFLDYLEKVTEREPQELKDLRDNAIEEARLKIEIEEQEGKEGLAIDSDKLDELKRELKEIESRKLELISIINDVLYTHKVLPYFSQVVSHFTKMPYSMIMGLGEYSQLGAMQVKDLEGLYYTIIGALDIDKFEYDYVDRFEFDGDVYYLPERFMENGTVIEFMESAQFQAKMKEVSNGNVKSMIEVCAVLLKKKGEQYSSIVYNRNRQKFQDLPMSVVANVAFFLQRRSAELERSFQIYTSSQQLSTLKQVQTSYRKLLGGFYQSSN